MSIEFHDGTNAVYKKYSASKKWNDAGLLQLNGAASIYDKWLIEQNSEENLRALLNTSAVTEIRPFGHGDKLGTLMELEGQSMIVVKGLHQWKRVNKTWNYKLHITLGMEGYLWHLDALYTDSSGKVAFVGSISRGDSISDETHDGFKFA